jgi:hypothetical protein
MVVASSPSRRGFDRCARSPDPEHAVDARMGRAPHGRRPESSRARQPNLREGELPADMADELADEAVSSEPVCEANSLRSGNLTGNFKKLGRLAKLHPSERSRISQLQENSLQNETGN